MAKKNCIKVMYKLEVERSVSEWYFNPGCLYYGDHIS